MKSFYNVATAIITGVLVGPVTWMLLDRDPPYIRESGEIVAVDHRLCGLQSGPPLDGVIRPGSCLEVHWKIVPLRTCKPSSQFSVRRGIIDQQGWHELPAARSLYSSREGTLPPQHGESAITRYFILPAHGPVGPATYWSSATFACNWLQGWFWPISVSVPDIKFMVGELPTLGPR